MARYVFITGGVVSSLGKGIASAALGALLQARGYQGPPAQARPLSQRRSGHDEPVSARRGLRHRRRRRDRSRPRPLRALHRPAGDEDGQRHHRPHLPGDHRQGTARRLSRRHRAGDPARHRRHQVVHPGRQRGRRFRAVRDRRHGRRHRGPAVLRGDPPARQRPAAQPCGLHPPDADALYRDGRRAEDQADPALGLGAPPDRHPAAYPAGARRPADPQGRAAQAVAVLQCARDGGDPGARPAAHLRRAGGLSRRASRRRGAGGLRPRGAAGPQSRAAGTCSPTPSAIRRARCRSPWSASTPASRTPTSR